MADDDAIVQLPPMHPGEVLMEDFLMPLGISAKTLSLQLGFNRSYISLITGGRKGISPSVAIRLEARFGASAQFWMALQSKYDLEMARPKNADAALRIKCEFGGDDDR